MAQHRTMIDSRSGFCPSNSTFYSKKPPMPLPSNPYLDVTTFISSHPHLGRTAFIDAQTGQQVTYPQLWTAVHSISTSLSSLGIRKGDVVLILSPNSIFFPIVCHSVFSLGAIITTANPLNTPNELSAQIADSKPVLAFTIEPLLAKLSKTNLPIVLIGNNSGLSSKTITTLDEMMKKEPSQARFEQRVNQEDTASLMYSSGTTGKSKGVLASHLNLIVLAQNVLSRVQAVEGHQTVISTVPMFHIYGFGWFALGLLASGSTIVVIPKFDKEEMIFAVEKYGVTYLPIAPPVIMIMIKNADEIRTRCDLSSLQTVLSGGAPLSKEVIEGFHEKYPTVNIFQGYALTESTGLGASTDSVEESKRFGSVGLFSASLEAKIVDIESRVAVGVNRMGELWLRGPSIMKGYLNNPEATASTLESNGWLKTGDLCYIDDDGFIYVVDRLKELIKYKGYQVPPAELESLLFTHPQILDAAVIPLPNKDVGQLPMAYVVRKAGNNLSGNNVMEFVAKQVAPHKRIRHVEFIDNIPKNPSGKILRRDLVKLATSKI